MKVGVPKEIKTLEFRVGMTPAGVRELVHDGHDVFVETNAGMGIGMSDVDYEAAGATVLGTAKEVFDTADLIIKVKEPQLNECAMLRDDQVKSTFQQRRAAVTSCEWDVEPASESATDKAAAEFIREQLQGLLWDEITDQMLYGVYYGYAVAELLYARDGAQVGIMLGQAGNPSGDAREEGINQGLAECADKIEVTAHCLLGKRQAASTDKAGS